MPGAIRLVQRGRPFGLEPALPFSGDLGVGIVEAAEIPSQLESPVNYRNIYDFRVRSRVSDK